MCNMIVAGVLKTVIHFVSLFEIETGKSSALFGESGDVQFANTGYSI